MIEQVIEPGRRYWTAYTDSERTSEPSDPLRFDMYAQRLGNLLLPGITNRTERLRYLSMVCAGIATTSQGSAAIPREQRRQLLPFERGWALAMTVAGDGELKGGTSDGYQRSLRPEFRSFRGANRVLVHFRTLGDKPAFPHTGYVLPKSQDAQGGLAAYLVTLRHFGLVQAESISLTAVGRDLASAFNPALLGRDRGTGWDPGGRRARRVNRGANAVVRGVIRVRTKC